MAFRLLRIYSSLIKPVKQQSLLTNYCAPTNVNCQSLQILKHIKPITCTSVRTSSFFTKYSAEALWKSVTSVSNAGKQRGRGRQTRGLQKNLNKGQYIGVGKINMLWPGLTGPIMRGKSVLKPHRLPDDPEREANLYKLRDSQKRGRFIKPHPLERGWTSAKVGGKSIGPPDPINDETFEGFETKVLEHKTVDHMTGNLGRKRSYSSFVITGNQNGICGIALGKSSEARSALRLARNRAGMKLMYIPRYNNHTVYHDIFSQFGKTKLFITKQPEGYGLRCHRAIKCACEVIGIKDLRVKIEGAINYQNLIKAFLIGLLKQKTHQQLADEKKLHLVEFRKENLNYPKIIASPSTDVRSKKEVPSTEILDFTQYVLGGKVVLQRKPVEPFYTKLRSFKLYKRKMMVLRSHPKLRLRLYAEYGELRSFLADQYPEARAQLWDRNKKNAENQAD